ncbi:glycerophosphodiester phosphodiesterase [Heliorestis convoluta]|uniref:Glycerophosphoryl diester phosphodiesterase family protein n=1 Tax=Heliorestis convoluta TaxID=356322 RepID=A0A5Q2N389_9FIRM|nr:glycerophosphodiester phosphodiesterase family protein [Heliorestis convoluta]QGG46790.1 glycerophosphoryl diester phosphodiesterase family protein [Heliorestis convoluta]
MLNACVAHRGWSGLAPENTLAAIKLAVEDGLIEMIEIDVQLSKDGIPVVIHDFTLDRTTNGTGHVKDTMLCELVTYDAGSWFAPAFAGEKIPTLEEVLCLVKGRKKLNIELKQVGELYPFMEMKVLQLIQEFDLQDEVVVTSFDQQCLQKVKATAPEIAVGLIVGRPPVTIEQLQALGAKFLAIDYSYITKSMVQEFFDQGIDIMAWTINDKESMKKIMNLHPFIRICTNHPEVWKCAIKEGGMEGGMGTFRLASQTQK